jgi:hypothetical protein
MSRTSNQGETTSYRYGGLKRKLDASTCFRFVTEESPASGVITKRLRLRGVSSLLNISIAAALMGSEGSPEPTYPANPGTINLIPWVNPPDIKQPMYLKPATLIPQSIPHAFAIAGGFVVNGGPFPLMGQYGTCVCDGADIEIQVDAAEYVGSGLTAQLVVVCAAEYNGSWWDVEAIERLLGEFNVNDIKAALVSTL